MASILTDPSSPALPAAIRVAAFTGGRTISSRRFRVEQYLPHLKTLGIDVTEYIARFGSWPPADTFRRPFWLAATLLDRIPDVAKSHSYDVTLLQREMASTLVTLERWTGRPRVLDLDDAVWLNRGAESRFPKLLTMCDGVICGNSFISEYVGNFNERTMVLPTAVDTSRFLPSSSRTRSGDKLIIGWSGLSSGFKYLMEIERPLAAVLKTHRNAVLRIVSDARPRFQQLDSSRVEYMPWSPESEVSTIQDMTVGLMPIDDSPWSRGKCSYKMLLYMACGVPVVVSPFGMNREVLSLGGVGFGAQSETEWVDGIGRLLDDGAENERTGRAGREVVEEHFSLQASAPRLAAFLRSFCE